MWHIYRMHKLVPAELDDMSARTVTDPDAQLETTTSPSFEVDLDETAFSEEEVEELQERAEMAMEAHEAAVEGEDADGEEHEMGQMGAKRIGSLAIGIGVVGIVLNQMNDMDIVQNSTGVIDVSSIFSTAGSGLNLLVVGVIIAAAAVLLNLWSGF